MGGNAYLLAIFSFALGLGLVLAGRFWTWGWWKRLEFGHVAHELGMAFIVSGVVFACIELTLHVVEAKAAEAERAKLAAEILRLNGQLKQEVAIRERVGPLLNFIAKPAVRAEAEYADNLRAIDRLAEKMDHIQLAEWKTGLLDAYGTYLREQGNYLGAAGQFEQARCIDERRAAAAPHVPALQTYVAYTYSQLAKTCLVGDLTRLDEARTGQRKAVEQYERIATRFKDHKGYADTAARNLARARRDLEEWQRLVPLRLDGTRLEQRGELDDTDLTGFRLYGQEVPGERIKVYAIRFERGKRYAIEMITSAPGLTRTLDPFLVLDDGLGNTLAYNDDGPNQGGRQRFDSRIVFSCDRSGVYRLIATTAPAAASGYRDKTGTFLLTIQELSQPPRP